MKDGGHPPGGILLALGFGNLSAPASAPKLPIQEPLPLAYGLAGLVPALSSPAMPDPVSVLLSPALALPVNDGHSPEVAFLLAS